MGWQMTPYTLPFAAAALISTGLFVAIYQSREKRGAVPLLGILLAAIIWSIADGIRYSTTSRSLKILMNDVRFLGPILVTVSIFLFAAEYTNREEWLAPRRVAALFAVHVLTFVLVWTNQFHELVRQGATLSSATGDVLLNIDWGPWYYVHALYSYLLLVGAAWMLVDKLRQSGDVGTYRGQSLTILVATIVPWGMNALFIAGITAIDLTALGFTVTGTMFAVALFRYQILELVPIARSTVVDNIDEGYIVLDTADSIVDVNETTTGTVGADRETLIGKDIKQVFSDFPSVVDLLTGTQDAREQIRLERAGDERFYDVDISPIYDQRDQYTGRVVLFRDITEQEQRKQQLEQQKTTLERQKSKLEQQTAQLEQQNERLEDFAGIVSHDLRNPINVLSGRVELAQQKFDDTDGDFEEMKGSIERMESLIDDVLTMAQQGQTVEDTELVSLDAICTEAWQNVDSKAATLDVETDRTVEADRNRLLQVFENLFRNAIDHGPEDVAIRVGDIDDGFFVEDDGPGIPPEERDDVLAKGYTTADDGTGFGLSIVQTAVEAHGWEIDVVDGTDGGARFEIAGVHETVVAEPDGISQR